MVPVLMPEVSYSEQVADLSRWLTQQGATLDEYRFFLDLFDELYDVFGPAYFDMNPTRWYQRHSLAAGRRAG